ncbi:PKU43604.1hypothetical protein llap_6084 [Octopus vulgaris]|uniref:Uncharacterized protein n=1 Tax=Octopus vulgaris TaxID=6645 RepID=A0AA36FC91_OCTVU|nr:PKU43604.1hypothetical protein llap_6084 [Octopus vulgaris]
MLTAAIFLPLYVMLVRPILEYGIQASSPYLLKDIQHLKRVQKLATRMVHGLKNLSYEERLRTLDLYSLEKRRCRGDLILAHNIISGKCNLSKELFFTPAPERRLRGHSKKLYLRQFHFNRRRGAFSVRVADPWNKLPDEMMKMPMTALFKASLDLKWPELFT